MYVEGRPSVAAPLPIPPRALPPVRPAGEGAAARQAAQPLLLLGWVGGARLKIVRIWDPRLPQVILRGASAIQRIWGTERSARPDPSVSQGSPSGCNIMEDNLMINVIGIDCAVQDKRIGLAYFYFVSPRHRLPPVILKEPSSD
jgi:hypothetical protein